MNLPSITSFSEKLVVPGSVSDGQAVITDTTEVMRQVNYFALQFTTACAIRLYNCIAPLRHRFVLIRSPDTIKFVVARHSESSTDEPHWLARIEDEYFRTVKESETHSGTTWKGKGWYLVKIKWLCLQNPGQADNKPRRYKLEKTQVTIQCNSISGKGTQILKDAKDDQFKYDGTTRQYVVHPDLHYKLQRYGDGFIDPWGVNIVALEREYSILMPF